MAQEKTHPEPLASPIYEAKLPTGQSVKMRELTGMDELHAMAEIGEADNSQARTRLQWSLMARSMVEIDGAPVDPSLMTPEAFRNRFARKDWFCLLELFDTVQSPEEAEAESFRSSIRVTA